MDPLKNKQHREGEVAKAIEKQTAKLPSDVFLWLGLGSLVAATLLHLNGNRHGSLLIGQWSAPFLICGVYDKIVKTQGHDKTDRSTKRKAPASVAR